MKKTNQQGLFDEPTGLVRFTPCFAIFALIATIGRADEFSETVKPFVEKHCAACHGPDKQKADLNLTTASSADHEIWINVFEQLNDGAMPPDDEPQPSPGETEPVLKWIQNSLKHADRPGFGNYLLHEKLFDETPRGKSQLTRAVLANSTGRVSENDRADQQG